MRIIENNNRVCVELETTGDIAKMLLAMHQYNNEHSKEKQFSAKLMEQLEGELEVSSYTTLRITRSRALEIFIDKTYGVETSNKFLESFIDNYLEPRLYNCEIVPDDCENDNDEV